MEKTAKGDEDLLLQEQSQRLVEDGEGASDAEPRPSSSSVSTMSLVLEHMDEKASLDPHAARYPVHYSDDRRGAPQEELDVEEQFVWKRTIHPADKKARRIVFVLLAIGLVGWVAAFFLFLAQGRHRINDIDRPHDPHATSTIGHGKKVTLQQLMEGKWAPHHHEIRWISGPHGEDGLLLERDGGQGRDFLVVEDVRYRGESIEVQKRHSTTLMKTEWFDVGNIRVWTDEAWPNADHTKVLILSDWEKNWRHSGTGRYWIFDVASQTGQPLDPQKRDGRIQLATWSPKGDAVVFTRDNNLFIRHLDSSSVSPITTDGGPELFYGIPDWVYEEEVFQTDSATWWSADGEFVAFLRTDESNVPEFPVEYFFSRPSRKLPKPGEESYPDVKKIKYPKAGAPMSVVSLQIYDVRKDEVFTVPIANIFEDSNLLITEVVWAGKTGKVLVRTTNRESDFLKMILIDARQRTGQTVRERDVRALDGGWFEISETTTFVPADPANGREQDGYIDTIIHNGYDHLAYFAPLDSSEPKMLTEGNWEVVKAPSKVALAENLVYFISTKDGSTQRHVYTVDLQEGPGSIKPVTDTSEISYYSASFSSSGSFMLLTNNGPGIPWQKVRSTPSNLADDLDILIEENRNLHGLAKDTELPIEMYQTVNIDGFELNLVERRPPHFDDSGSTKYPVLFFLYNGPGYQEVNHRFSVDFQSYIASNLGYIVVTLDGRGTGYLGRETRCIVRGNLGYWEAHDQIAAAKKWSAKDYVDSERMAIWGWSYGGFMTLKILETDAGQTFKYGMAVAPVTDWRYYDSIYTERYMHMPQHNREGYANSTISDVGALGQNVKFLVMHGTGDDNVHFQNTLSLLDKLDIGGVMNYDVHVFPDSDHSIMFHEAYSVVHQKLSDWLVNAFNGEWLRTDHPTPIKPGFGGLG